MTNGNITMEGMIAITSRLDEIRNSEDTIHDDLRSVVDAIEKGKKYSLNGTPVDPIWYKGFLEHHGAKLDGPEEQVYFMASTDPRTMFGGGIPDPSKVAIVKGMSPQEVLGVRSH